MSCCREIIVVPTEAPKARSGGTCHRQPYDRSVHYAELRSASVGTTGFPSPTLNLAYLKRYRRVTARSGALRITQLELDDVHPVGRARGDDLVAEVVERRMHILAAAFAGPAVADHDVGAGLLLQHEGEILGAGEWRRVGLDILAAH